MKFRADNAATDEILAELRDLKRQVAELEGKRDAVTKATTLADEVLTLREQIETLKIERLRKQEEHDRKVRDVEHMVGLQRKRQEFEVDSAKRDAVLSVREENLKADRARFEQQMDFMSQRFGQEVGYLKEILGDILDRLPTVKIDRRVGEPEKDDGSDG